MSEKYERFSKALNALIQDGEQLYAAIQFDCYGEQFTDAMNQVHGKEKLDGFWENLPDFKESYQAWYSEAQSLIKQVLPGRLSDFQSYYEYPRVRKDITFQNYMIRDYLQGLKITGWDNGVVADGKSAIPEFAQQLSIVKAAKKNLESALIDIKTILQADLFDSEVEAARALQKAGFLRGAGAICGVVLEKHLLHVCQNHAITIRKKNPTINVLNQALADKDVITVPQWRFVQHLADIRNLCDHAKGKEPSKSDIEDLIAGTEKVMKTVY